MAATVGLSAAGGIASYYIVDAARGKDEPMIGHVILTMASETNSDSLLAVNFGGAESGLVLITLLIVIGLIVFKCHNTCHYRCCGRKKKLSRKRMERAALVNLADVATALGPHIKKKAIVNQGADREKQIGGPTRTGRKRRSHMWNVRNEPWWLLPTLSHGPPPPALPPPPPYPSTLMKEEEDMELCSGVYSTIQDVDIINIP